MTTKPSSIPDARAWLTLLHAPGIGPAHYARLLACLGTPARVLAASPPELRQCGLSDATLDHLRSPDAARLEQSLAWLAEPGNHLITCQDPRYPALLAEIPDPPPLLFVRGDPTVLDQPQLAMVGSRNPTPAGLQAAHDFAAHLAGAGMTITSGLALGIDGAAHYGALDGPGRSIAVMGTGLDRVYPARHRDLAHQIAAQGALVSEFPPGTPPKADHFPRRNRIISGLSLGTLVVEAALRSGSLITARLALEQGREVFAMPGSIHNPLARGCHALIRQGAKLVENAQDIAEELGAWCTPDAVQAADNPPEGPGILDGDYQQLLDCMGYDPVAIDGLVNCSGLTAEQVSSMLLLLELQDYVVASAGGRYARTEKRA